MPDFKAKTTTNKKTQYTHFSGLCKSCGLCIHVCPVKCLFCDDEQLTYHGLSSVKIDIDKCIACMKCVRICPDSAINIESLKKKAKESN